jgi:ferric-dicitrate binding protein FerR (iron transport regulator)
LDQTAINELIQKVKENTATDAEKQALMEWYRSTVYQDAEFPEEEASVEALMLTRLETSIGGKKGRDPRNWYIAAASAILLLGIGTVAVLRKPLRPESRVAVQPVHDIAPGANVATLTLANGSTVSLTDAAKGNIAEQGGIRITKSADGQIVYTVDPSTAGGTRPDTAAAFTYNKIEIPAGGQYQVVLPDGTRVWLNSSSWLKFPVHFSPTERKVELSGEAYFDVRRDPAAPFRIASLQQDIEVLGTQFNVHAYPDEAHIRTTLVDGAVRVTAKGKSVLLAPKQEADLGDGLHVSQADVEAAIAWKNGYFRCVDQPLGIIMKQVSRWYNVKVAYEDEKMMDETFGVLSNKFSNISVLLKMMEKTGNAKFTVNGATVVVSRKK